MLCLPNKKPTIPVVSEVNVICAQVLAPSGESKFVIIEKLAMIKASTDELLKEYITNILINSIFL